MNTTSDSVSMTNNDRDPAIARTAAKAHETVDRVAASVTPVIDRVRSSAEDATHQLQARAHDLMETRDQWLDDMRVYVKERPLTTIGVTAVVALLLGRFWAR
jgi:ElaB/YqjD/DUF883 family membrane-anchored ribosome-binding protein